MVDKGTNYQDLLDSGIKIGNLVIIETLRNQGEMTLAKQNKIGDIKGNTFASGTVIQSEDVTQTITISNPDVTNAYQDLLEEIKKISDDAKRQQAEFFAENLSEAINSNDTSKGKKMLDFLKGTIGTVGSLTTIAKFFGYAPF